jgi:hypothetical protein
MKTSLVSMPGVTLVALGPLAGAWALALAGCTGQVVEGGGASQVTSSSSGAPATSSTGGAPGTSSTGGAPGTSSSSGAPATSSTGGGTGSGGMPAGCDDPDMTVKPYTDPIDLYSMIMYFDWLRCEGTIQPAGGLPAPDGEHGLLFESFNGPQVALVLGIPAGPAAGMGVTPWVGNQYETVSWTYVVMATGPGISFTGTTIGTVYDQPVFTSGAKRMTLSDPVWKGTYVHP